MNDQSWSEILGKDEQNLTPKIHTLILDLLRDHKYSYKSQDKFTNKYINSTRPNTNSNDRTGTLIFDIIFRFVLRVCKFKNKKYNISCSKDKSTVFTSDTFMCGHNNCSCTDHQYLDELPDMFCYLESTNGKPLAWVMGDGGHFFNGFYDNKDCKNMIFDNIGLFVKDYKEGENDRPRGFVYEKY